MTLDFYQEHWGVSVPVPEIRVLGSLGIPAMPVWDLLSWKVRDPAKISVGFNALISVDGLDIPCCGAFLSLILCLSLSAPMGGAGIPSCVSVGGECSEGVASWPSRGVPVVTFTSSRQ